MRADRRRERARPLEQRSRREWNAPPPGRERAVPGRPAIDRHRGDGEANESEKKARPTSRPRSRSYLVRTEKCVRVRVGSFRVRESAAARDVETRWELDE